MKKIGIFSGTFDPVHGGHLSFAQDALDRCGLDKIFFLVEPRPRRKQGVKAFEHRVQMVKLALRPYADMGSIVLEQARFTPHETLPLLKARFKGTELYMLMGEDMLDHLADWPHVAELVNGVHFIIGVRRKSEDDIHRLLTTLNDTKGLNFKYDVFQAKDSDVSSSIVKAALRKGKRPKTVDSQVMSYIKRHNLYSSSDN